MALMDSQILGSLYGMLDQIIAFIPTLIAVIVLLIVGLILGKALGKIGATILDKIGLDNLIDATAIGGMIKKAEITTVGLFEAVIKWFIYLIFAVIIIDILKIEVVATFITDIIAYIPLIISALVVLLIGLLIVDFIVNLISTILKASGIDDKILSGDSGDVLKASVMAPSSIISGLVKLFGYLIFILAAVNILKLTIVADFLVGVVNYLPNLFTGILILIIGMLVIDFFADHIQDIIKGMDIEGMGVLVPAIKGFLFFIVILMAFDTMLIDTSIFYILIGPLAWGIAVVVAFKWGIKEALVAYAKAKK
ncbi:MAG: hypothetical protein M8350_01765 [Methanosarcinaceae archaeon]|nr:hypothetical protein [Methanosarcinaceae archaeon]